MTFIANSGKKPDGSFQSIPIGGAVTPPVLSPLPANGVYSTGWIDTSGYGSILYVLRSDKSSATGGIVIEYSNDASTAIMGGSAGTYDDINQLVQTALVPKAKFTRITYTNGTTAQTTFYFEVKLSATLVQPTENSINRPITSTNLALVTKGPIEANDGTGVYDAVNRTGNSLNVNVTNQGSGTQAVSAPSLGTPADTLVTDPTQSGSIVALLKGLLQESVAQAATGSFTAYTLVANAVQTIPANGNGKGRIISSVTGTILVGVGFTATTTNWSYRIVTNGTIEIRPEWGALPISLFSTAAATVNVTVMA